MMASRSCQGHAVGRCRVSRRADEATRAGTVMSRRRIVAVVDVYDALVSRRAYKPPWPVAEAMRELHRLSGVKFDPELVELFLALEPQRASPLSEKEPPAPA